MEDQRDNYVNEIFRRIET